MWQFLVPPLNACFQLLSTVERHYVWDVEVFLQSSLMFICWESWKVSYKMLLTVLPFFANTWKKANIVNIVHRVQIYCTLFVGFIYIFARSKSRITSTSKIEFFLTIVNESHWELHFRSALISKLTKAT